MTSHSQDMHENQSGIRLLTTTVQMFDNMVQRWRTYHAGRFIHKINIYKCKKKVLHTSNPMFVKHCLNLLITEVSTGNICHWSSAGEVTTSL